MRLSDNIELFIKNLLEQDDPQVELKRNELAEYFGCAPSQINYVLATRFTPDNGYVTESRRGGGGYIRIVRVVEGPGKRLLYLINQRIGDNITQVEAARLIAQLVDQQMVTAGEGQIMLSAVSDQALSVPLPDNVKNAVRARTLRAMLISVAKRQPSV